MKTARSLKLFIKFIKSHCSFFLIFAVFFLHFISLLYLDKNKINHLTLKNKGVNSTFINIFIYISPFIIYFIHAIVLLMN